MTTIAFRLTAIIAVTATRSTFAFSPAGTVQSFRAFSSARRRLFSSDDDSVETTFSIISRAKDFIRYKNAAGSGESTLDPVFDMCSNDVDLYGLTGDEVRPGFTAFFEKHNGLQHDLLDEPTTIISSTDNTKSAPSPRMVVQYPFTKTWKDENGEWNTWKSVDPTKPRNKVEQLEFDDDGMLLRVSVVDLSEKQA